jgi:hypothetical protein
MATCNLFYYINDFILQVKVVKFMSRNISSFDSIFHTSFHSVIRRLVLKLTCSKPFYTFKVILLSLYSIHWKILAITIWDTLMYSLSSKLYCWSLYDHNDVLSLPAKKNIWSTISPRIYRVIKLLEGKTCHKNIQNTHFHAWKFYFILTVKRKLHLLRT